MSHGITEANNSFEDYYKTDNFDNNELQARLYAEIYYDSNIEGESRTTDASKTIQLDMVTKMNIETVRLQHELEEQLSETARDSQKMVSTNQTEFNQVDTLASKEINPVACDNEGPEDPLVTQENKNGKNSPKKYKSSKRAINEHQESIEKDHNDAVYSKYNVDLKYIKKQKLLTKQINENENNSDSEESIFEVPVPPKPKPPLIDLQDSDEENDTNSGIDLILKKWGNIASIKTCSRINQCRNPGSKIVETPSNHQNISFKSKNTDRPCNNNIISPNNSIKISTCVQEITEDIVLNCTAVQRGVKNISEIKQLSKSVEANQGSKSIEDINQNCKRKLLQNKSKGNSENNANLHEEISATSGRKSQMKTQQDIDQSNIYNVSHLDQVKMSRMESCNLVMARKRQCNNEIDSHPKRKRQCIIQQNNQDVIQGNNEEKRDTSNKYFKPMSEEMRNYYNLNRGQENFDIGELQQGMSKDPRMWAILDEDIMPCPSSRQHTRFWNVKCTNCHQDGHQRYDCSSPRRMSCCYMCGMKGHTESRCPQKMCLTCGKQQNTFRNTCEYCRVLYCTMCNSVGHELEQCPDLWRRYHQTTDTNSAPLDPGNVMKPSRLLYCCNCAKHGHESSRCKEYRWSEHFPTPAVVTNYTDGPTYTPCIPSSSRFDSETSFLPSGMTGNETSIPQNTTNIQYATEDVESSANIDTSSSSVNFCIPPTSQETMCTQMEENLKSSSMTNKIWSTVKTNLRQTKVNHVTFISITYSCGHFHKKNHKDARMILKNLTTFFTNRKSMLKSLINREVTPVFLKTLLDTAIEFEVKIGFTQHQILSLQLLAMKEYIEYLYDLLEYWLNLLDDEKDGIDVILPRNPVKMFNVLNSRMPQLEKTHFTCYAEHIGGINDPRWLYNCINSEKANLKGSMKKYEGNLKKYNRLRKKLWRLQIKLLMIVNTEPKPNVFVRTFQDVMKRLELERHQMGDRLDTTTYLRLILLYNQLFVPHTSENMYKTFHRINIEENKNKNSLQLQQELEITVHEQGNLVYNNMYPSSTSSCTPQNINLENFSTVNKQQNEMLSEGQNVNNILLETNKTTDRNCEIITINSSPMQDSQIMPLNIEPVSSELKDSRRNEGQLSTSKVNNTSANKQNINLNNMANTSHLTKKERKRLRELNKLDLQKNIYDRAFDLIRKARTFKLPHMMNAADEMQRQINNQTIKPNHIQTLSKLILLEKKYRKDVNTYCKNLKK